MKNLLEAARVAEMKERTARLRPDSERLWGKMDPAQALAHRSLGIEWAVGWPEFHPEATGVRFGLQLDDANERLSKPLVFVSL